MTKKLGKAAKHQFTSDNKNYSLKNVQNIRQISAVLFPRKATLMVAVPSQSGGFVFRAVSLWREL
jgi:adenine C2-methylase RlmN of 23S rRNA A2503 and tRNA A37